MSGGVRGLGFSLLVIVIAVIAYLVVTAKKPAHKDGGGVATAAERLQEVKNPAGLREEIIPYTGMTVSFNRNTHEPNWVAWELLGSEVTGESGREPGFLVDPEIDGCALPEDYRNTGFDRGHMAPAGDMKWHPQAMRESFYMTNICPQSPDLNRGEVHYRLSHGK
jgi:endonuclease G, mitochondrial